MKDEDDENPDLDGDKVEDGKKHKINKSAIRKYAKHKFDNIGFEAYR